MEIIFKAHINPRKNGTLDQPLGPWLKGSLHRNWMTYYDRATHAAIFRLDNVWVTADVDQQLEDHWTLLPQTPLPHDNFSPTPSCVPVSRLLLDGGISISVPFLPVATAPPDFVTWSEFVQTLPEWERILVAEPTVHDPIAFRRTLSRYSASCMIIVSDGSTKDNHGAYGWEMEVNSTTLVSCYSTTNGNHPTPLRSECFGILSWAIFLSRYCTYHGINTDVAKIQPYSDSELAIQHTIRPLRDSSRIKSLRSDYDVTVSLSHTFTALRLQFPMLFPIQHIKGHTKDYAAHPSTLLLEKVDKRTKAHRKLRRPAQPINLSPCRAYLERDGDFLSRHETNICRWSWRNEVLFTFYAKKFRIEPPIVQRVNWAGYSAARTALSAPMKRFAVKLTIGWLPVGERIKYYGNEIDVCHLCPSCETPFHLFQCAHRIPYFFERHAAFRTFLESVETPIAIIAPLSDGLLFWATSASPTRVARARSSITPDVLQCVVNQDAIGWSIATFGILDRSWSSLIPDPKDIHLGDKWQSKVTNWLIHQAFALWTIRNTERNEPDPVTLTNAALRETEAQVARVFTTLERLPIHDRHELVRDTIDERLRHPEHTNRLWAAQLLPMIYRRIKYHEKYPDNQDIRQFFPVIQLAADDPQHPDPPP